MSMQNVYDCLSPPERLGNAPVGSNSSGPAVIPSVSEGGTMVGERSMRKTSQASSFGGRWRIPIVVRNMPNRRGGGRSWWWDGLWIMWVSTKGVHIGCFQGDGRILKRFAVPPCMLEEYRMIWARPFLMSIMIVHFEWTFCCKNSVFSCLKNEKNIHLMNMLSEYLCVFFEI